jgi:chemotaxis protein methyltransferase CheR
MKAVALSVTSAVRQRTEEEALSRETYSQLQRYIQAESGIVLEADKQYLVEARLRPVLSSEIAKGLKLVTLNDLCQSLVYRPSLELSKLVVDAMTTNETFFFRDTPLFDALQANVLPSMFQRVRGKRKLRIWSAASSSGQEAYSLAIVVRELGKSASDVEIIGTDLSTQMIARARQAKYVSFEVQRGLPAPYLQRYFVKSAAEWQLVDAVRSMVQFEQTDLRRSLARMGQFDLILCRNVLIYFDTETKKKVVGTIKDMLAPGGLLALGCAETIININDGLYRQQVGASTFYSANPRES